MKYIYIIIIITLLIFTSFLYKFNINSNAKKLDEINVIGSKIRNGVIYNTEGKSNNVDHGGKILEGSIAEFLKQEESDSKK